MQYKPIITELLDMQLANQSLRQQWAQRHKDPSWIEQIKILNSKNTKRLKEIVEEYRWPTISKVGVEASGAAWLLVQHADHDLDFQSSCLALMEAEKNDVDPKNIDYLTDRILVSQGQPQIYGTQFYRPNGKTEHIPRPLRDPDKVDELRAAIGMGSLKENLARINN